MMNRKAVRIAAAAFLATGLCFLPVGAPMLATATGAPAAAPAATSAVPVTSAFLVGYWTDDGDCTNVIEFRPDGTFQAPSGTGLWMLTRDKLIFQGVRTVTARVQAPDPNTIILIHPDGSIGRSTRCPSSLTESEA
ncbi:MAG: hypothetical protein QOC65_709 [Sphingomonadales bacterium]|nr:hypothetical protein [Sphingomonadales bacterium]